MNTAKMTLVSTVVAAAFGLALGLMSTPAQAHCPHKDSLDHRHCDGGGTINYTAELTMGGFEFGPIDVIANSKENLLTPSPTEGPLLELDIPNPNNTTWKQVFDDCPELLKNSAENGSIVDFEIGIGQLRINKSGGVRVLFVDIRFDEAAPELLDPLVPAEVTVILVGNEFDFDESFLPTTNVGDETRTYGLDGYLIRGETLKGIHPRSGCKEKGSGTPDIIQLNVSSELEITASAP